MHEPLISRILSYRKIFNKKQKKKKEKLKNTMKSVYHIPKRDLGGFTVTSVNVFFFFFFFGE